MNTTLRTIQITSSALRKLLDGPYETIDRGSRLTPITHEELADMIENQGFDDEELYNEHGHLDPDDSVLEFAASLYNDEVFRLAENLSY